MPIREFEAIMDVQIVCSCSERCKLSGNSIAGKEFLRSSASQCYHDPYKLIWANPVRLQSASYAYRAEYGSNFTSNITVCISSHAPLFKRPRVVFEYIILTSGRKQP